MMEQIVVTLKQNKRDSVSLEKMLPEAKAKGSFAGLVDYLANPVGDENNPPYEDAGRRALAQKISAWMGEARSDAGNAAVNLRFVDEHGAVSQPISMDARVSDYLGRMVKRRTVQTDEGPAEFRQADLVFDYNPVGGR